MAYLGLAVVGLAALVALVVLASAIARWIVVRAVYGMRGVPFPFGAGWRCSWTTTSPGPRLACFAASLVAVYLVPGLLMGAGTALAGHERIDEASMRVAVVAGGPAEEAGVRDGDRIDAVDDAPVASWEDLKRAIAAHPSEPLDVAITRDGRPMHLEIVPDAQGRIRVTPPVSHSAASAGEVLRATLEGPAQVLVATVRAWTRLVLGRERAEISGPVGIVRETAKQQERGAGDALRFVGALGAYAMPIFALVAALVAPGARRRPRRPA